MKKTKIVTERLYFVRKLIETRETFRGQEDIIHIGKNGWNHPLYMQYSALRFYLLLTCFDILGQTNEFIDFYSWLNSSSHKEERDNILKNIKNIDQVEILKEVHIQYNKIYGMSNSFKRFINVVLSDDNRAKLLDSIDISKHDNTDERRIDFTPTVNMKIKFLFEVRNSFTHKGKSLSSGAGGLFYPDDEDAPKIFPGDKKPRYASIQVHKVEKAGFHYRYYVRRWPSVLIDIIEETIEKGPILE